jgi:urease accessory protein
MSRPMLLAAALLLASPVTFAHPADEAGLGAGLIHALTGFDHMLAMLSLGIWSASLPQASRIRMGWGMPLVLISALLAGIALHPDSVALADMGIACSLVLTGILIVGTTRIHGQRMLGQAATLGLAALFVALHGFAHTEALSGSVSGFAAGLVITSTLLMQIGRISGGWMLRQRPQWLLLAGALVSSAGISLVFA